ncbi:MAG TPA: sigma-70 family RNA polymerase sigma factor [Burkholderiaceae bacterium]|nr:sigma-70 family RNA polymerase sigma factor [Burkholderiaceae bacterium]
MSRPDVPAPAAFRQQLLDAIPRLRRYARSLVFDAHAADDLVQTALERALTHWHQFDQRRDILVWTISIARNAFIDERRRQARLSLVEPDSAEDASPYAHLDRWASSPGADVGLRLDLIAALKRLPVDQREALLLVSVEQFSYAECAEALAIPIGTVMSRVSRGRSALRALLDGGSGPPVVTGATSLRRVV